MNKIIIKELSDGINDNVYQPLSSSLYVVLNNSIKFKLKNKLFNELRNQTFELNDLLVDELFKNFNHKNFEYNSKNY